MAVRLVPDPERVQRPAMSTTATARTFRFFNLEQAEYVAHVYLEDPEVLRADVLQVGGCWQVVVTSR